jgi:Tfp pilus assembly protein PilO
MSQEQPMAQDALASRRQVSIRIDQLKRSPALNIVGLPELIGLAGAAVMALLVVFAYFYFYVPANSRLASMELERTRLVAQRQAFGAQVRDNESTRDTVDKIDASLKEFESNSLAVSGSGRMSLYTVLNDLIKSNGLRNTAGPTYSPLEPAGTKQQAQPTMTAEKQSNAKWQSIYPGIAVSVTVEGPYQNVRHFVRDIESSRQFLIINAVELERVTQSGTQDQPLPAMQPGNRVPQPSAGGRASLVSLRIDLATYFQRGDTKSVTPN